MRLMHSARLRVLIPVMLLSAAALGCGTLEVGIVGTAEPGSRSAEIETRTVQKSSPAATAATVTADPPAAPEATPVPESDPPGLYVAFSKENNVWLWTGEEEAIPLTRRGGVEQIKLSDDGAVVAFTRGGELWMVRTDGTDERPLVTIDDLETIRLAMSEDSEILIHSFDWVPGMPILAYNTRVDAQIGLVLNDDLRTVSVDTVEQTLLLSPGDGGEFSYSPDGLQIAIVTAGSISLVDVDGGNRRDAFTYTPVSTASEFRYYARPTWATDSRSLRVVIPPANPFSDPPQPATVWQIPADGLGSSLRTEIEMALMSDAFFSPDLRLVAHPVGQPSELGEVGSSLLVSDLDLRGSITYYPTAESATPVTLASGDVITYVPQAGQIYGWAPDGQRLAFAALTHPEKPFQVQIGELGGGLFPAAPDAEGAVIDFSWVDRDHYLVVAQGARGWNILLGQVEGTQTGVVTVGGSRNRPAYDFAAPHGVVDAADAGGPSDGSLPAGLVFGTTDGLWLVDSAGEAQLVSDIGDGAISPDGARLLYSDEDDIWILDLETGDRRNLTSTPARVECCPQWWPGQPDQILFNSWAPEEAGPSYGSPTVTQLDGADYRILDDAETSYSLPAPSPDGTTVAYDRAGKAWLYTFGSGSRPFDPSQFGVPVAYGSPGEVNWRVVSPSWSPDGRELAWVVSDCREGPCGTSIGLFRLVDQTALLLHPHIPVGRGGQPAAPHWSPDGRWLAYNAWAEDPGLAGLWVVQADGQGEHALAPGLVRADPMPVWSPDGRWLAFGTESEDGESRDLWLATAGRWDSVRLDLPADARLMDWVQLP